MPAAGDQRRRGLWYRIRRWLAGLLALDEPTTTDGQKAPPLDLADPEEVARANVRLEDWLEDEFRRNVAEPVRVTRLRLRRVDFFGDTTWDLHPSVNVLLGRNGYGKSLLLRSLAGMLQRDEGVTADLFGGVGSAGGTIELDLARDGRAETIRRDWQVFLRDSTSRVPLLAIPDARFADRSTTVLAQPSALDLARDGARHFLEQLPYQSAVEGFLTGLAAEYWRHGRSFSRGTFAFLDEVMTELTGSGVGFDSIEDVGRTGARIWVRTDGLDRPLEIQRASQGTLSVVAIFGLIHQFLEDIGRAAGKGTAATTGIVLIDEVDAHLHPAWQRRIRKLLTDTFPGVQFILSAHSPLVVAGCGAAEVAVLRRAEPDAPFIVEELLEDFIGATPAELYDTVFEIEDRDEVFLEYATKKARGEDRPLRAELNKLSGKRSAKGLSGTEQDRLHLLAREVGRIEAVQDVEERQADKDERILELEADVARLESRLGEARR